MTDLVKTKMTGFILKWHILFQPSKCNCWFPSLMSSGQLEWQDKKSMGPMQGTSSKITRNLLCMVSIGQSDPEM